MSISEEDKKNEPKKLTSGIGFQRRVKAPEAGTGISEDKRMTDLTTGTHYSASPIIAAKHLKHYKCICCDRNVVVVGLSFQVKLQRL